MEDLGRYLGAYMLKGNGSSRKFQHVIDKMQNKLSSWKKKTLSLAGRLTLVQSITNQMAIFYMQHSHIPAGVRQKMEKIQCDFIWNKEEGKRKMHTVSWELLCKEKKYGGYGLRDLNLMNDALLGRVAWNTISQPESLCSRVLCGKYRRNKELKKEAICMRTDSELWKNLCRIWPEVVKNLRWEVGNGREVKFWTDVWLDDGRRLIEKCNRQLSEEEKRACVNEMLNALGQWDMARLEGLVSEVGKGLVLAAPPPNVVHGQDSIRWGGSVQNEYVVADMYYYMKGEQGREEVGWKKVWNWKGPRRIQIFLWIASHEKLLTGVRRRRLMGGNSECCRCNGQEETLMHVMRDCHVARNMWNELCFGRMRTEFLSLQGRSWFEWNLGRSGGNWSLVFGVGCWMLWNWRNRDMFDEGFVLPERLGNVVLWYVKDIIAAREQLERAMGLKSIQQIKWTAPEEGWLKINTDGASKGDLRRAGCGGLIRDSHGKWVRGFARRLGICSAFKAELWAVLSGLELACGLNLHKVVVECDSVAVVAVLSNLQVEEKAGSRLLSAILMQLGNFSQVRFVHVYREANFCADVLANISFELEELRVEFVTPPLAVCDQLYRDEMGFTYPRNVLIC